MQNARKMPFIYVGFKKKNCNGNKTFSGSPHMKYHNPLRCSRVDTGGQSDMAKLGGVLIYINFRWKRMKKNLSERVD
jgi:hypothetical protein